MMPPPVQRRLMLTFLWRLILESLNVVQTVPRVLFLTAPVAGSGDGLDQFIPDPEAQQITVDMDIAAGTA